VTFIVVVVIVDDDETGCVASFSCGSRRWQNVQERKAE
jgi:hypothetical protein